MHYKSANKLHPEVLQAHTPKIFYLKSLRFRCSHGNRGVKIVVLSDVALCSLVDMDGDHSDDGNSKHL